MGTRARDAAARGMVDGLRRAARVDNPHKEIVRALRKLGAWVLSLATVGKGCPDLLVAFRGVWVLLEVKSPGGVLSIGQKRWHAMAPAPVFVVETPAQACLAVVEAARPPRLAA